MNLRRIRSIVNIPFGVVFQPQNAYNASRNPAYDVNEKAVALPHGDYMRVNMPDKVIAKRQYHTLLSLYDSRVFYVSWHTRGSVVE